GCNEGSFALHRRKTCVSRSCGALLDEVLQDVGRQRGVEVVGDPDLSLPATWLPAFPVPRQGGRVGPWATLPLQSRSPRRPQLGRRAPRVASWPRTRWSIRATSVMI